MKSTGQNWNDGYGLAQFAGDGRMHFFVNGAAIHVQAALTLGEWSHVVGTYDGTTIRIYVNGVLADSRAYAVALGHSSQAMNIGMGAGGGSHWKGGIEDVAIYGSALSAAQVLDHYNHRYYGLANIELLVEGTSHPHAIATAIPNTGQFDWTIPVDIGTGRYRLRVSIADANFAPDSSDAPFLIANGGNHFYVNDSSMVGNVYTSAAGNNANSGKSSTAPMASLRALVNAYDLDPGDVIHVDTGTYRLYRSVLLAAQDSGVRIEGPGPFVGADPLSQVALMNRGKPELIRRRVRRRGRCHARLSHRHRRGNRHHR
jgi:hypothetical protein